jgi:hypothetical protein
MERKKILPSSPLPLICRKRLQIGLKFGTNPSLTQ